MQDVHGKLNEGLPLQSSTRQEEDSFHQELGSTFKEETSQVLLWSMTLYGAGIWTIRKVGQKYLYSFEI